MLPLSRVTTTGIIALICLIMHSAAGYAAPLHEAVKKGDLRAVRQLISEGADVNALDPDHGLTPLHLAAGHARRIILKLLIKNGAELNPISKAGAPLHIATGLGYEGVVSLLLQYGADPAIKFGNLTAEDLASSKYNYTLERMIRNYRNDPSFNYQRRPSSKHNNIIKAIEKAEAAAQAGDLAQVKKIINQDAKWFVPAKRIAQPTSMHIAAQMGSPLIIKFLIENGENPNERNKNGQTPLHDALSSGQELAALALISGGAKINLADNWGWTELHHLAIWDRPELLKLLIQKGAQVDAREKLGLTPLHILAKEHRILNLNGESTKNYGYDEMVELLVNHGAQVNAKDNYGYTPLFYAVYDKQPDVATMLRYYGGHE